MTSGKRAGGVAQVLDNSPVVPGLAIGPHAFNPNSGTLQTTLFGVRYQAGMTVTLASNGTALGTVLAGTAASAGTFATSLTFSPGADTSAVLSAYTTTVGSLAGQSVEPRADAGTPPSGDNNPARLFIDRPIVPLAGGVVGGSAEGFRASEPVTVSGCATATAAANANGALVFTLRPPGFDGTTQCVITGGTSARVARGTIQYDANAINSPSAIAGPGTLTSGAATFVFVYDRLLPSQAGTIYLDGVSLGAAPATNANGYNSVAVPAPTTAGIHEVAFVGASGQVAIAPLYITPAGATPTPTRTATAGAGTATTTATAGGATATATTTPCVAYVPEIEPNNTITNAQTLATTNNVEVRGGITPSYDVDYYGFGATSGQRVWPISTP